MSKRIMSVLLCLVMCMSLAIPAFATNEDTYVIRASAGEGGYIKYGNYYDVNQDGSLTVTIIAHSGWKIKDVYVDGESVGAVDYYTFSNVNANHFIRAEFERYNMDWLYSQNESRYLKWYVDVNENHWYHKSAARAIDLGVVSGYANTFDATALYTRGEIARLMYRLAMDPICTEQTATDVTSDNSYYYCAVNYCVKNGYISLFDDGTFRLDAPVTREELALILWKYHGSKEMYQYKLNPNDRFVDVDEISSWHARNAMTWCVQHMIYIGNDKNELNPTDNVTRAEAATILVRYMDNVYNR